MSLLTCTSPIEGAVVAARERLSAERAIAICARAKAAQHAWAARPIAERIALVRKAVAIISERSERRQWKPPLPGLSVLGYQALTRPKSYHLKKKV